VRMREARRDLDLATETLGAERGAKVLVEDLDRYTTFMANVASEEDGSHTAFTKLALDFVTIAESGSQLLEKLLQRCASPVVGRAQEYNRALAAASA
jgi:hypothetical protein